MLRQKDGGFTATEAGEIVRTSYQNVRRNKIIQREIEPRGLDLNSYYSSHQQLSPNVVQMIDNALSNVDMGVQLLIAWANGESFSIYTIVNPGTITDNSSIGRGARSGLAHHTLCILSLRTAMNLLSEKTKWLNWWARQKREAKSHRVLGRKLQLLQSHRRNQMLESELQSTYLTKWAEAERQLALNWNTVTRPHSHVVISPEKQNDTIEPKRSKKQKIIEEK